MWLTNKHFLADVLLITPNFQVDSEVMAPVSAQVDLQLAVSSSSSAVQQQKQASSSKPAGCHPNQQALAALAGSPTSTNGANCDPDVVRQLPEVIRHVLHGCVGTGGYGTVERGAHLTVYVTSADPAGTYKLCSHILPRPLQAPSFFRLDNPTLNHLRLELRVCSQHLARPRCWMPSTAAMFMPKSKHWSLHVERRCKSCAILGVHLHQQDQRQH